MRDNSSEQLKFVKLPYSCHETMLQNIKELFPESANSGDKGKSVYAMLIFKKEKLTEFMFSLQSSLENSELDKLCAEYDEAFFDKNALVLTYTDERSGGNRLSLEGAECDEGVFKLTLLRRRGLTMDMSLSLIFMPVELSRLEGAGRACTFINEDEGSEASLF